MPKHHYSPVPFYLAARLNLGLHRADRQPNLSNPQRHLGWGQVNCWPPCEVFVRNLGGRLFDPLANAQVYEFDQDSEPHREIDVAFRDVLVETLSN